MNHTPTPWRIERSRKKHLAGMTFQTNLIIGENGITIFKLDDTEEAEFIVRACNNHEKLKEILMRVWDDLASGRLTHSEGNENAMAEIAEILKGVQP